MSYKFLPSGGFAQVAGRPDYLSKLEIQEMDEMFTSHQFILKLAQQHQRLYIKALHSYRDEPAPFRTVHGILAKRLHDYSRLIELVRKHFNKTVCWSEYPDVTGLILEISHLEFIQFPDIILIVVAPCIDPLPGSYLEVREFFFRFQAGSDLIVGCRG